jgi:ABC-type Fe3+ transport system substrate-binding protein
MSCRTAGIRKSALSLLVLLILGSLSATRAETIDQLYEKAKLEKSVVVYTGAGPAFAKAVAAAFEKRFPGITVTAKGGFSNVLDVDVDQQLKDDKVTTDFVQFQTIQDYRRWDKAGALMHFKPDGFDRVLDAMKAKDGSWVAVNAIPLFYGYNSDKVQAADLPKSALDFLKPLFRGNTVTVYPSVDDATLYNFDLIVRKYGWNYMKTYMANQPYFINGSHRDVAARVKSGEGFVSFDMSAGPGGELKIAMSEKDRTPVFFTAGGILKNAPHPNAARLFLTWMLSKEWQGRNPALYSPRRDVPPPAGMPPLTSPRFANGYAGFLGDGTRLMALRKRFEAFTGPITNKSTVQ